MKHLTLMALALATIITLYFTPLAHARDTLHNLNVNEALQAGRDEGVLLDNV